MDLSVVAGDSAASVLYALRATVIPFRMDVIPPIVKSLPFDGDLKLGPFRPRKLVWAGEQRRGISMHIAYASPIEDHMMKSLGQ